MKKLNNKGFALVETLIVSIFVMVIFTVLYTNLVPMMGEYEKRENYDNVNNIYKGYLISKLISDYSSLTCNNKNILNIYDKASDGNSCSRLSLTPSVDSKYCPKLLDNLNVLKIYMTKYKNFSNNVLDNDPEVKEYVKTLGTYSKDPSPLRNCRIIIKYEVNIDVEQRKEDGTTVIKKKNQFATVGV